MKENYLIKFLVISLLLIHSISGISEACVKDSDCIKDNHCLKNSCRHNSFFPFKWINVIGLISILFASAISNAGGIGGGTLFLPVLILIMNFYTHEAVPLSKIVIFTGSCASFYLNTKLRHPTRNAIALNYNIIITITPNLLFGTLVGVTLNIVLPNAIIIFLLSLVLFYNTYKTAKIGIKQYKKENEAKSSIKLQEEPPIELEQKSGSQVNFFNNDKIQDINKDEIELEIKKDDKLLRWDKLKFILISYIILIILSLIRESKLLIQKCSITYWVLYISFAVIAMIINYFSYIHIHKENKYRESIGFPYDDKDIKWTNKEIIEMILIGFVSGLVAGTIGIGGGVILGPILLGLNIYPIISTVTTNFLVLLTSSSTTLQFILNRVMNFEYGTIGIVFSMLGSYIGTKIIHYYFQKTGRESLLIFALVIVIGSSAIILPAMSIASTINDLKKNINVFRFNNPCNL